MVQWALSMAILYGSALLEEDVPLLMVLSARAGIASCRMARVLSRIDRAATV